MVTVLVRLFVPSPQVALHAVQSSQSLNMQGTGQSFFLHFSDASLASSHVPPCCASAVTVRERVRVPGPHSLLHALQSPQSLNVQGTGQSLSLHSSESSLGSSHEPPCCASIVTVRERVFVP